MDKILRFPSAIERDPVIEAWLNAPSDELGDLVRPWFSRMRTRGNDVRELMHDGCPTACVDDAPFGYVNIYRDHANVGFFYGAELSDPAHLLEGGGKRMRHVKLKPGHPVDSEAIADLVDAAYLHIRMLIRSV